MELSTFSWVLTTFKKELDMFCAQKEVVLMNIYVLIIKS